MRRIGLAPLLLNSISTAAIQHLRDLTGTYSVPFLFSKLEVDIKDARLCNQCKAILVARRLQIAPRDRLARARSQVAAGPTYLRRTSLWRIRLSSPRDPDSERIMR
ncbi:hypothetical protein C8Q70DRAFT_677171 [Cubamyces menziesii]|nr:hypothetical protein C8Q70DRAFT_677171 [Cubamyces menziesii]